MIGRLRNRWLLYRRRGLARSVRGGVEMLALGALRPLFGFAAWHAHSPTSMRPYRIGVAAMIDDLRPGCVVEVGCGLGAVLARTRAPKRIGYDTDRGVIRAARLLRSRAIDFRVGGFEAVDQPAIDVLVAINWLQEFPPEQLEHWLLPLLPRTRFLLLDRVETTSPLAFSHHHDFAFLAGRATAIRAERFGEDHRWFVLFEVKPDETLNR